MTIGVVIPAAGQGKRMGSRQNKIYMELNSYPILYYTLLVFTENRKIDQIVVVVKEDELEYCQKDIIDRYFPAEKIKLVAGGKTRRESVYAGLKVFSPAIDYVIIHDGARPLITQNLLNDIIDALKENDAVSVGTKLKDTVKVIDEKNTVIKTPERDSLIAVQTPQAFLYREIMEAHQKVPQDYPVTDDASLLEYLNKPVKIVEGSEENIKITTSFDLLIAEKILERRSMQD